MHHQPVPLPGEQASGGDAPAALLLSASVPLFIARPPGFGKSTLLAGIAAMRASTARVCLWDFAALERGPGFRDALERLILRDLGPGKDALEALEQAFSRQPPPAVLIDNYEFPLLLARRAGSGAYGELLAFYRSLFGLLARHREPPALTLVTGALRLELDTLLRPPFVDLSRDPRCGALLGLRGPDLARSSAGELGALARTLGVDPARALEIVAERCGGYRFDSNTPVLNPRAVRSLLKGGSPRPWPEALSPRGCLELFYTGGGESSDLGARLSALIRVNTLIRSRCYGFDELLAQPALTRLDDIAFLYQSGFVSVSGRSGEGLFFVDYPNAGVKKVFEDLIFDLLMLNLLKGSDLTHGRELLEGLLSDDCRRIAAAFDGLLRGLEPAMRERLLNRQIPLEGLLHYMLAFMPDLTRRVRAVELRGPVLEIRASEGGSPLRLLFDFAPGAAPESPEADGSLTRRYAVLGLSDGRVSVRRL